MVKTLSCQIREQGLDPYGEDPTCHVVQPKQRRRKLLSEWPQRFSSTLVSIFSKVASAPLHELSASALSWLESMDPWTAHLLYPLPVLPESHQMERSMANPQVPLRFFRDSGNRLSVWDRRLWHWFHHSKVLRDLGNWVHLANLYI